MKKKEVNIMWFRQDLRLSDNPALYKASEKESLLPIYIFDTTTPKEFLIGEASRCWLHHSLLSLNSSLKKHLSLYKGSPLKILLNLVKTYSVRGVFWNRCYEPWQIQRDSEIKSKLSEKGISVNTYNGSLLWEPWEIKKENDTPYQVFSPFYRRGCLKSPSLRIPLSKPEKIPLFKDSYHSISIEELALLPSKKWGKKILSYWNVGELFAHKCLEKFIQNRLNNYKLGRDFPSKKHVSKLSPHLHFGEISPNQIWFAAKKSSANIDLEHFCSELGWREFSYNQLYFNPEISQKNINKKFNKFPWSTNNKNLEAWKKGMTGIPFVDAGMRELWETGYMHNRLRMVVASFLVKNLLIHWKKGMDWFWNCLLDADLANNSASWQWVAGSGYDAVPYFRIFNPVIQGEKFDPQGEYTKKYIPELSSLPIKYLFKPWEAPKEIISKSGLLLGKEYPNPIVDLQLSRKKALEAFKGLR